MTAKKLSTRQRGVILTDCGSKKLDEAIEAWKEAQKKKHNNASLDTLWEEVHEHKKFSLSPDTSKKIYGRTGNVDFKSIESLFNFFDLGEPKENEDYSYPDEQSALEPPQGQVPLNSRLYIERPPIEQRCYKTIMQPGAIIRIKAPKQMGKTSLMARIADHAKKKGYQVATVDFRIIDKTVLTNLDQFLKWFCAYVGRQLQRENNIEDCWEQIFGSKVNCYDYFEEHILGSGNQTVVLALDEVDRIFEYQDIAEDFLGLLRAWHEAAKHDDTWKRLRLILAHSTEVYIPININQSPFNVGLPVELSEFKLEQVQKLAKLYQLELSENEIKQLMDMVGGHPYLVRVALYHLADQNNDLNSLLTNAPTEAGVYSDHLRRHLSKLEANPDLAAAMKQVVESGSIPLKPTVAYKLNSMGLTKQQEGDRVAVRCQLYQEYFRRHL
jgi:serine/threonine-protein kinase